MKEYRYPEKLPGELYDANTQCKWQFGEKAKLCMLDFKKASECWQVFSAKCFITPLYSVKLTLMYAAFIGYLPNVKSCVLGLALYNRKPMFYWQRRPPWMLR